MNTCWILLRSNLSVGRSAASSTARVMWCFFNSYCIKLSECRAMALRSSSRTSGWLAAENSSSSRTMTSARRMASRISVSTIGTVSRRRAAWTQRKSTPARTVWSGFRTSCATPAASVPIDSSFSDWINCDWVVFSSSCDALSSVSAVRSSSSRRASSAQAFFSSPSARLRSVMSRPMPTRPVTQPRPSRSGALVVSSHRCSPRGSMTGSS